jgi:hypothetical protein
MGEILIFSTYRTFTGRPLKSAGQNALFPTMCDTRFPTLLQAGNIRGEAIVSPDIVAGAHRHRKIRVAKERSAREIVASHRV